MGMERHSGMLLTRENQRTQRRAFPIVTVATTNPTRTNPASNSLAMALMWLGYSTYKNVYNLLAQLKKKKLSMLISVFEFYFTKIAQQLGISRVVK
jgi:hypothetical protein